MAEEKKVRYSRKRERIYEWILSRDDHPSAEEIYLALRPEFPDLSLGTVYKNLHFLEDHGRISRVLSPQGVERPCNGVVLKTGDHDRSVGFDQSADGQIQPVGGVSGKNDLVRTRQAEHLGRRFPAAKHRFRRPHGRLVPASPGTCHSPHGADHCILYRGRLD